MASTGWAVRFVGCARLLGVLLLCGSGLVGLASRANAQGASFPASMVPSTPQKGLIAVMDLQPVDASKAQASAVTDQLREEFLHTGLYTLVDRAQMDAVLNEQAFQQAACTTSECAVKAGKLLGVRSLVTGRISKLDDQHWQLSAELIDVQTAETLRTETLPYEGPFFSLLTAGSKKLAVRLANPHLRQSAGPPNPDMCAPDSQRLCKDVKPGEGRIWECLMAHQAEWSQPCVAQQAAVKEGWRQQGVACSGDMNQFCKDVKPGDGRPVRCLWEHEEQLSTVCLAHLMPR